MYMALIIVLIIVVLGGALFVVSKRKGPAPAAQQTPTYAPPPMSTLKEGSVTDGTYEFQTMAPEKAATPTKTFLAFDGPPGSLGGPAAPTTVAAAPSAVGAPGGFRVDASGDVNKLFWAPAVVEGGASISFYKIYRGMTPTSLTVIQTVGPEEFSWVDDNFVQGTAYYYKVSAETISGEGPSSEIVSTSVATPPTPPIYPNSMVDGSTVLLTWKAPPNDGGSPLTGYQVHRGPSIESLQEVATMGTEKMQYSDMDVAAGTQLYAITAETANGRSPLSKVIEVEVRGTEG
jgi:hypothetical protein